MSATEIGQAASLWLALAAATAAALFPWMGRLGWWLATLLVAAWLALAGWPGPAAALGAAACLAVLLEPNRPQPEAGFSGVLRAVVSVGAAYAAAALVLVRLLHAEFALAEKAYPALAAALVAVAVLANAQGERDLLRATRLLAVLAAVAWVTVGGADQAGVVVVAAAWLPLLAAVDRLRLEPCR